MVVVVLLWARVLVVFLKGGGWVSWGLCSRTCGVAGLFSSAEGTRMRVRRCVANPSHDDDDDDSDSDASCVMRLGHPCRRRHRYRLEVESASAPAGTGCLLFGVVVEGNM